MTWGTLKDAKYDALGKEINKQRDRGAAIIAAAVLEDHLLAVIKAKLTTDEKIEDKMFRGYGPLASFSARIDLGLLLGLYEKDFHKDLHRIREIRNEFAHNLAPLSFRSSQQIRDLCRLLEPPKGASRSFHKTFHAMLAKATLVSGEPARMKLTSFYRSTNPRTQYIRAIQRMTMAFAFMASGLEALKHRGKTSSASPEKYS